MRVPCTKVDTQQILSSPYILVIRCRFNQNVEYSGFIVSILQAKWFLPTQHEPHASKKEGFGK